MKKIIMPVIAAVIVISTAISIITYTKSSGYRTQKEIADNIIRFHVRANSDSDKDQNLKLKVKDAVVSYLQKELSSADSLDDARNILYDDSAQIKDIAQTVIKSEGMSYNVDVYFEKSYFPLKTYGDMSFPPGEYEAFRIDIGEAGGHNWWCVLYPNMCFQGSVYEVMDESSGEELREVLTQEEYADVFDSGKMQIRWKFLDYFR